MKFKFLTAWFNERYIKRSEAAEHLTAVLKAHAQYSAEFSRPLVEKAQLLDAAIELIRARDEQIARDMAHVEELIQLNQHLEQRVKVLETPIKIASQPLYSSETAEDFKWQLDNNVIDMNEYQSLIKQLEFDNAELTLDYEAY